MSCEYFIGLNLQNNDKEWDFAFFLKRDHQASHNDQISMSNKDWRLKEIKCIIMYHAGFRWVLVLLGC